jgi:uncharacterized protein (DUF427 family)
LGGKTIADSKNPLLLIQFGPNVLPTYFFTHGEVDMTLLGSPVERDGKRFWTVQVGGQVVENGAWTYVDPPEHLGALKDRVSFTWETIEWYEEAEQVFVHARNPHKRVDVIHSSRHVRVVIDDQVIADTQRPALLFETWLPTRYYIPKEDVRTEYLEETSFVSQCPYKGTARYWNVKVGDRLLENVVWSYPKPITEAAKVKDMLSFFNERVDIFVDGELEPRPETPWS